jgi:hypothetical protein
MILITFSGLIKIFCLLSTARMLINEKPRYLCIRVLRANAEEEGFEPPVPCGTTVFKTAAFDHSAIPPGAKLIKFCDFV